MADRIPLTRRSLNMSRIRNRDTLPELFVRSFLHRVGLRFRTNVAGLPGRPDVAIASTRDAIFVHGCFWHRHDACPFAAHPKSNSQFWVDKFKTNVERDRRAVESLAELGWKSHVIWECEIATFGSLEALAFLLLSERDAASEG